MTKQKSLSKAIVLLLVSLTLAYEPQQSTLELASDLPSPGSKGNVIHIWGSSA